MVDEAAKAGDDVGEDEYKDDDDYGLLLSHSEVFVATCEQTREAKAFIVIQPCLTSRFATKHIKPCLRNIIFNIQCKLFHTFEF